MLGPSVLLILADDVGVGDAQRMPSVRALAGQGINFTDAHSSPLCSPSRYALLSGNSPLRQNRGGGWGPDLESAFANGQRSIATVLQEAGFRTGFFGKWGIGGLPRGLNLSKIPLPIDRRSWMLSPAAAEWGKIQGPAEFGFDTSYWMASGIQAPPYAWFANDRLVGDPAVDGRIWRTATLEEPRGVSVTGLFEGGGGPSHFPELQAEFEGAQSANGMQDWRSYDHDPIILEHARKFLRGVDRNKPFFLQISTAAAHGPLTPPRELNGVRIAGVSDSPHSDMIHELDLLVSHIVQELSELERLESTLVIFTSDNGGTACELQCIDSFRAPTLAVWTRNNPCNASLPPCIESSGSLRGHKGSPHEGGHRVPMIWRWDARLPRAVAFDGLIAHTDLFRTLLSFAGIPIEPSGQQALDSLDFSPVLTAPVEQWPSAPPTRAGLLTSLSTCRKGLSMRHGTLKLIVHPDFSAQYPTSQLPFQLELYDLHTDLAEANNLLEPGGGESSPDVHRVKMANALLAEATRELDQMSSIMSGERGRSVRSCINLLSRACAKLPFCSSVNGTADKTRH